MSLPRAVALGLNSNAGPTVSRAIFTHPNALSGVGAFGPLPVFVINRDVIEGGLNLAFVRETKP